MVGNGCVRVQLFYDSVRMMCGNAVYNVIFTAFKNIDLHTFIGPAIILHILNRSGSNYGKVFERSRERLKHWTKKKQKEL